MFAVLTLLTIYVCPPALSDGQVAGWTVRLDCYPTFEFTIAP